MLLEKYCPCCKCTKSTQEFYKAKNRKDGLQGHCKTCCQVRRKINYYANPEKTREYFRLKGAEYRSKNPERARASQDKYRAANQHVRTADQMKRKAKQLQRTPKWLTDQHLADIRTEYALAAWCSEVMGVPYHVDHIVPMNGKTVSGLHVPWNLQVIPASVNVRKSNKFHG